MQCENQRRQQPKKMADEEEEVAAAPEAEEQVELSVLDALKVVRSARKHPTNLSSHSTTTTTLLLCRSCKRL